jgi:hypothetical protein
MICEATEMDLDTTQENIPLPDVGALNRLLREERAAEASYAQAVEKFRGTPYAYELLRLREEHRQSAMSLRDLVNLHGAEADDAPAKKELPRTQGGLRPLLIALRDGEDEGAHHYREALESQLLSDDATHVARNLLQRCREHVDALDRLSSAVA